LLTAEKDCLRTAVSQPWISTFPTVVLLTLGIFFVFCKFVLAKNAIIWYHRRCDGKKEETPSPEGVAQWAK
jgi:hypothetical protein